MDSRIVQPVANPLVTKVIEIQPHRQQFKEQMKRHILDKVADLAITLAEPSNKDNAFLIGFFSILVFCLFWVGILFGVLSWITGIGFWWFWLVLVVAYLSYAGYIHLRINRLNRR